MEEFVEEIKDLRTTNFKVTKIPVWALKKFKKLCKEQFGDIYFVGIIQLMKTYEEKSLFNSLSKDIENLQKQIDDLKEKKNKSKTFGEICQN